MGKYRCDCGDTECPSCGTAQGTYATAVAYVDPKVSVWEERDRLHIHLFDGDENSTIAEWWDDDARSMFDDGFFDRRDLAASVIDYAKSVGLIA